MNIAVLIARILLGLIFILFGSNGFLNFLPAQPLPPGAAGQFLSVLMQSHYVWVICTFQVVGGVLLLINRYVPLALALLAPVIVNILSYHSFMSIAGLPLALFTTILWSFLAYRYRQYFFSLFVQRAQ